MRKFLLFFVLATIFLLFILFHVERKNNKLAYDDDQAGLNEQIVIKFSHVVAENTPKGLAAQKFAKLVEEKTQHKVKVEVYSNGILYSDEEAIDALRQGSIQMIAPASSKLSPYIQQLELLDLPFAFETYENFNKVLNGEVGSELLSLLDNKSFTGLAFWSNGFKQLTSNNGPITKPEDLYGQHFRIMPGKVIEDQFKMLNVETSPIPFNLTYSNLLDGILDGQENTLSNIYSKKFYEVQDYMTISNHGFLSYVVIMNQDFWSELPPDVQIAVKEAMEEATVWNQQNAIKMNTQALKQIQNKSSITIHTLTESEKEVWKRHLAPVYDHFKSVIGEDLIRKIKKE